MTDREVLIACLEAFTNIDRADDSRKLLKRMGVKMGVYQGTGSYLLAKEMRRRLRHHLDTTNPS
jgi:hypothetical protein